MRVGIAKENIQKEKQTPNDPAIQTLCLWTESIGQRTSSTQLEGIHRVGLNVTLLSAG